MDRKKVHKSTDLKNKKISRRDFLEKGGAAVVATVAVASGATSLAGVVSKKTGTKRYGMLIDLRRCTGCQSCTVACKAEFNVRLGAFRSKVITQEKGDFPNVSRTFLPVLCNQCSDSTCSLVCPTKATYVRDDGIVAIDKDKCIGCRYCISACPYGARYFNWVDDKSGDVSRNHGTVDKCDFCIHRVEKGLVPSCVNGCPHNARIFGDLNDPNSKISKMIATNPVSTLQPDKGTNPNVYYIGLDEFTAKGGLIGGR